MKDTWKFAVAGLLDAHKEVADDEAKDEPITLANLNEKITMTFMMFDLVDCPGTDFGYLGSLLSGSSVWFDYCCRLAEKLLSNKQAITPSEEIMLYSRLAALQEKLRKAAYECRLRAPIPELCYGERGLPNLYHVAKQKMRTTHRDLMAAYANHEDANVRRDAMLCMDDEDTLASLVQHSKHEDVRLEAIRRLGWIEKQNAKTKKVIAYCAKDDENPKMRLAAVALLGDKGLLRHIAQHDPTFEIREAAAKRARR